MKKLSAVILALLMTVSLFACDNSQTSSNDNSNDISSTPTLITAKRGFASGEAEDMNMPASNLVDGNTKTVCATGALDKKVGAWFAVDLGKNYDLSNAKFFWGVNAGKACKVEYSRGGVDYTLAAEGAKIEDVTFEKGTVARYVKLTVTDTSSVTTLGYTMCEIEIYGKETSDQTLGNETGVAASPQTITLTETNVFANNKAYEFNSLQWSGAEIRFKTTDSRIVGFVAECQGTTDLNVSIDGGEFVDVHVKEGEITYMFGEDLDNKPHEVRIIRENEPNNPPTIIKAAIIEETASLVENYKPDYSCKIMVFGDSISAGLGLETYTQSYAFRMSELVNAQTIYNVKSGGKVHYSDGEEDVAIPLMFGATEYMGEKDYDFSYQPDLVLVACGINDTNPWRDNPDESFRAQFEKEMQQSYYEFFEQVHLKMPSAKILYSKSCGLPVKPDSDPRTLMTDRVIRAALAQLKAKYPEVVYDVFYVNEARVDQSFPDREGDVHPGPITSERDSKLYAAKVKQMLGLN